MLGYGPGELTGVHRSAITPPDDVAQNEERYRRFLASGMPSFAFEKRYLRKDGSVIWVNMNVSFIRDADGEAKFSIIMAQDITERKRSEEALEQAHEELELRVQERTAELHRQAELLNLTHDAIIACDLNHKILFWNRGAEERYGWTSDEARGKVTDDLLRTVYSSAAAGDRAGASPPVVDGRENSPTRRGTAGRSSWRAGRRYGGTRTGSRSLSLRSTVTSRRRNASRSSSARPRRWKPSARSPAASPTTSTTSWQRIIGFTELALDDVDQGSRLERNLQRVLKAGIRARELVKQILTFSRATAKEREAPEAEHGRRRGLQAPSGITSFDRRPAFYGESESGTVLADPTQIQQIVMNLCTNAVQAMEDRGS